MTPADLATITETIAALMGKQSVAEASIALVKGDTARHKALKEARNRLATALGFQQETEERCTKAEAARTRFASIDLCLPLRSDLKDTQEAARQKGIAEEAVKTTSGAVTRVTEDARIAKEKHRLALDAHEKIEALFKAVGLVWSEA